MCEGSKFPLASKRIQENALERGKMYLGESNSPPHFSF